MHNISPGADNGLPVQIDGIDGIRTLSFSGGRVAADLMSHGGLGAVRYYGRQRFGGVEMFKADALSGWIELFRPVVIIGDEDFYLPFGRTEIYPFGYRSIAEIAGVTCEHEMLLANNAIYFRLRILGAPAESVLHAALVINETYTASNAPGRHWEPFRFEAGRNAGIAVAHDRFQGESEPEDCLAQRDGFHLGEVMSADIHVGITSSSKLELQETPPRFRRLTFTTADPICGEICFAVAFAPAATALDQTLSAALDGSSRCAEIYQRWHDIVADQAGIRCPSHPMLAEALSCVRPTLDSLKVRDIPGAMRAADSGYWVWGWDTMVYPEAWLWSGDARFVLDILDYYCRTADPTKGIFHAARLDNMPHLAMAPSAQTLYCVALYKYYCHTGDIKGVETYFQFAAEVLKRAKETCVAGHELLTGVGMYPDYPEGLEQDGHDISTFNNSIYYQALLAMADVAAALGRNEDKTAWRNMAAILLREITQHLYDSEKGYFYDSISSLDFSPRKHYPLYAVLWITPFAADLVEFDEARISAFMAANFAGARGPLILPKWDRAWKSDGNELCIYMPVIEKFYREMMCRNGYDREVEQFFETVKWFWSQFTFPEALTARVGNHDISFDQFGRKQGFTCKVWYSIFMETICGLRCDGETLRIERPFLGDVFVERLPFRGKRYQIAIDSEKNASVTADPLFERSKKKNMRADNTIKSPRPSPFSL